MEDKGEKIIFLARELLESNAVEAPVVKKSINITMSFKTLCFTTLLAATGGNVISTYVHEQSRPLNRYEKVELQALVYYAAKIHGISESFLREDVERQVGVDHFDDMTAKDFLTARRYLQEKAQ
ncbi:MAG: hypothetical protein WC521_01155 [Bdellovibrionales bacterium]|jgi:hypothetical protein